MGHSLEAVDAVAAPLQADEAACHLSGDLGWLLKQAYYALASEIHEAFVPLGISPRDYHVLEAALAADHTQSEIAEAAGLDKTTMVGTMDALEAAGLAERRPSEHDRRVRVICVTPAGQALVLQARETVATIQHEVLDSLAGDRGAEVLDGLRELVCTRLAEPIACTPPQRRRQPRR